MTKDSNTTVKGYKNAIQSIGYAAAYPLNPPLIWWFLLFYWSVALWWVDGEGVRGVRPVTEA